MRRGIFMPHRSLSALAIPSLTGSLLSNPSFSAKLDLNKSSRLLRSFAWRSKRDAPRRRVPFPAFLRSPHLFFTPIFRGVRGARSRASATYCRTVPYRRSLQGKSVPINLITPLVYNTLRLYTSRIYRGWEFLRRLTRHYTFCNYCNPAIHKCDKFALF